MNSSVYLNDKNHFALTLVSAKEKRVVKIIDIDFQCLKKLLLGNAWYTPRLLRYVGGFAAEAREEQPEEVRRLLGPCLTKTWSFSVMMITSDSKVLLLERTNSFYYDMVKKLEQPHGQIQSKAVVIDCKLLDGLYQSELDSLSSNVGERRRGCRPIFIMPGGHARRNETVIEALLREINEETSIAFTLQDLRFCHSYVFELIIHDCVLKKTFNNLVFPVKIGLSSADITRMFKSTVHTDNPTFVDIVQPKGLVQMFIETQSFMLIK
jgi:ADP-ribose pyrophosphatase YjhB (NUDIX family)